jgi:hypothetical protein
MMPMLDQVFSVLYGMKENFKKELDALKRYASMPDAKQSYIDERNRQLESIAKAIEIIEFYIDIRQMLYRQSHLLRYYISNDSEFSISNIPMDTFGNG